MDQNALVKLLAGSAIRHALTALSGYLVARHLLASEHSASLVNDLTNVALDALPGLIAMVMSYRQKKAQL